jgi:meromycolic acid enoyl-[acyl-carrier-protein] reductase
MLADKRLLLTGIVTTDSIAFAVAERAQLMGAELLLTAFPRDRAFAEAAASALPRPAEVVDLDVTAEEDLERVADHVLRALGGLDGALHAVAFAPRDALSGDFLAARPDGVDLAFRTSAFSYASLGGLLARLAPARGGALVGLDFDAAGAWPVYNWMGVCKAALESVNRYLARDLGPRGIRANLVAAGPLHTRAAGGIPDFDRLLEAWETGAPLAWDPADPGPVGDAVCFLLSDLARAVTGEILHVDGGHHAMAGPLRAPGAAAAEADAGGGARQAA